MTKAEQSAWMHARFDRDSPARKPTTLALQAQAAAAKRRQWKRARQARIVAWAKRGWGWYDPRREHWTLSAECPEWADEMRRVERLRLKTRSRN